VRIKELNNNSYRRQSAETDDHGEFTLTGLAEYRGYMGQLPQKNANGTFTILGISGEGEPYVELIVEAEGFAPQSRHIALLAPTNVLKVALSKGNIFRGQVLDETGNPIPDAAVRTDVDNQGLVNFRWNTTTDPDGRFEWNSAPAEPTLFWFEALGYRVQRDVLLVADGTEHQIRLQR
jgi:Carboxypeptidase regulatory-like domain